MEQEDMTFEEFRNEVIKSHTPKQAKVRNSFGVYDCYKLIRKNKWYDIGRPVTEHEFYSIVRGVNNLLADSLVHGDTVVFPSNMGKLELRKWGCGASIVGGKLKVTYPVDWNETLKLWYSDVEARNNKTLLRKESKEIFCVRYCKHAAAYNNKVFYEFCLNRKIKKALKDKIERGEIDTLW